MSLAAIDTALDALRAGRPVLVADDEGRENEGDVVLAAETATPEWIAWTLRHSSGFICAPMPAELADRLALPVMVAENQDPRGTNYTVTVDAADRLSTGISAADRAHTLRVLADPSALPASLNRPGHILPLRAAPGGVRERAGHTEAAVDLMRLAGLQPVAAIAEAMDDDGEMTRLPGLIALGEREDVPVITIEELIAHLDALDAAAPGDGVDASVSDGRSDGTGVPGATGVPSATGVPGADARVRFEVETRIPTSHGRMLFRAYRDRVTGFDHLAVVSESTPLTDGALVRVHSECLTGEAFGSRKCECGPQLDTALDTIAREGGAVIYLRGHEGRGIGLINKLRAYRLQEEGYDTLDANTELGFPADARDYGAAVAILQDLGLRRIRLLSNNPDKRFQLEQHGVQVDELVPLLVGLTEQNERYLETKRDRMGHALPDDIERAFTTLEGRTP